jgi:flagellar biosynthetic protein FliO
MDGGLLSTTIALAVVCALALGALRAVGRRGRGGRGMRLVSRLAVEPRRSLVVVEVAGRWLVVSVGDGPMALIAELDAAEARAHLEAPGAAARSSAPAAATDSSARGAAATDSLARGAAATDSLARGGAFVAAGGGRTLRGSFAAALKRVLRGAHGDEAR